MLMTSIRLFSALVALGGGLAGPAGAAERWTVLESSRLSFTFLQEGQPTEGEFETFSAEIAFDPEDVEASRVEVEIELESVDTGHSDRDDTLRSSSLFNVERWPSARFTSDELVEAGEGRYEAHGALSIRDVTRDIVLPFELSIEPHPDDPDQELARARGEVTISRLEFGVGQGDWSSTSQIAEDVVVQVAIDAVRAQ